MISDNLAKNYSWKGQKNKNAFKDLQINKIIMGKISSVFISMSMMSIH